MGKSYKFDLTKYYNDTEMDSVAPILENFNALFADEDGVANLDIADDVRIVVKRDEGAMFHMVLDDGDYANKLPKSLKYARKFADKFITAMAKAVDDKRRADGIAKAQDDANDDAENDLLAHIGGDDKPVSTTKVVVNGKPITDPDEQQKVIDDINAKVDEMKKKMAEKIDAFSTSFNKFLDDSISDGTFQSFFNKYLKK